MITARTDVVGSLLRPPELVAARKDLLSGAISPEDFKASEDRAVDQAIALQEEAGLEVVTDGEQRRLSFQSQMAEAVEGFGDWNLDAFLWGDWKGDARVGSQKTRRPESLGVVAKLKRKRWLSVAEFVYLKERTNRIPKITLPSPSLFSNFWSKEKSSQAYPKLDGFLTDVTSILKEEVDELVRCGANYIQLDAPHYPLFLDSDVRQFYESQGWTTEKWLQAGIEMDNAVIGDHPGVTFGFHLCRGNQGSRWLVEGTYDLIAKPIFKAIRAQRLLLEYDDSRSGSFEPLKEVPDNKTVVLGLLTTKSPREETVGLLAQRIREASGFVPLDRLAISPQCGFGTSVIGNALSSEDQKRKLATLVATARTVWDDVSPMVPN